MKSALLEGGEKKSYPRSLGILISALLMVSKGKASQGHWTDRN
jgi:hypothetical protein